MATIERRSTRKRTANVVVSSDSEEDIKATSNKKSKKMGCKISKQNKKDEKHDEDPIPEYSTSSSNVKKTWSDEQLLAELKHLNHATSARIVRMFDEGNTIPFMCRYRREVIDNLSPDEMRDIKITYNHIKNIRAKADTIIRDLSKRNLINEQIEREILSAKSLDALDHLYGPFKTASKSSLFERAKALGLEKAANDILCATKNPIIITQLIDKKTDGIDTLEKVKDGIKNIISYTFSKDTEVLEKVQEILTRKNNGIKIETTKSKIGKENKKTDRTDDASKFEIYSNFQGYIDNIQSHQTMAINRAENLKFIAVKIVIPDRVQYEVYKVIKDKYFGKDMRDRERLNILESALNDAYTKKLKPLMNRQIRSMLTKKAEKESVEVFAKNLKQLFLLNPVKGKKILGIDPGFKNGCKLAMISEQNEVLETAVIYPHTKTNHLLIYEHRLANLLKDHQCEIIAIGNGTACRQTENWIAKLISRNVFHTKSVRYCVVSENGASIYSCSNLAKQEFPDLDVNLISAISIARRLSDPLAELVKIEPKHLGIGMYQHDIGEKFLMESLNEVVIECVSFVGVDINTASSAILKYIAGFNAARADNVIKYRTDNGPFNSRDELKNVKSIGAKTFEQCAGFIRIDPKTANLKIKYNILDSTWVHPESYGIAKKIITKLKLDINSIGTESFVSNIKQLQNNKSMILLAKDYNVTQERIQSILEALGRESQRDYRDDSNIQPLFKQGLLKMSDLQVGMLVSGAIQNITTFGCFVDIGVEHNGLIHTSQLCGKTPNLGDRVNAFVIKVEAQKGRIQLRLESIIE